MKTTARKALPFLISLWVLTAPLWQHSLCHGQKPEEIEKPTPLTRILFVFDASQSMYGRWQSDLKINIAQRLLSDLLDSLALVDNLELALRVYGHQKNFPPQDCDDSRLEVSFSGNNAKRIKQVLRGITPRGTTPIAYSLEQAGSDFPPCDNCRNIIVLITDGIEECNGDPCAVSRALQKKGLVLKPFIIGIGKDFKTAFDCVGTYYDASDEVAFSKALNVVISQALNSTTAQVNLLDTEGNPKETNVNMTFYDRFSGLIKYNFIHTLNHKGLPDTLVIDPLITYRMTVHTIPPVHVDSIQLSAGRHTIIPVSCPQGSLYLKSGSTVKNLPCIIRQKGLMETINVQTFNTQENYLTGSYDLEVLCLPRLIIGDVEIMQSHTTTVEIPVPGIAVIQKSANGYGSLYQETENGLIWLYNFRDSNPSQETVMLQPGQYRAVFRSKYADRSIYTVEKSFRVSSGETIHVKPYQK
ncbi:MAG TPA: VWA domain-containing protein [Bacteroidales bacterium]|nr:VWA domain-containing protein [Bacteroidales bacterium]HSA43349.1 VWA domain-containing protein [Bacteroidales bacterium]